ncbi:MAG TPA: phosphatidate cytidylyltransferase [Chitinophagaceae bacterium]|nr:phosphatidate cytidylyltransferase [Chitinophagaceae bacterium]
MAFNWKTFWTRTFTGAVFIAVMLTGLLWNHWSFLTLFTVIHFGCWWEYLKLMEKIHRMIFHPYVKMGLMVMGYGLMLWFCGLAYEIKGYGLKENLSLPVSAAGFALILIGIFHKTAVTLKSFGAAAAGLLYISFSWGLMVGLRSSDLFFVKVKESFSDDSWQYSIMIIVSIWINDTMAYLIGSMIGKTPLSKISPKKTWEGTIGGIILSVLIMFLIYRFSNPDLFNHTPDKNIFFYKDWIFIPLITSVAGIVGDLFESKLKRMADVKDSGRLMPGHGGFLDRFDSMLFATPFVWLYVLFFA